MIGVFPSDVVRARTRNWIAGLVLLLFFASSPTIAQQTTATILGTVKDTSGAVVPGANVTATDTDTGAIRTSPTDSDGSYRFSALPIGHFQVKVEHEGFQTEVRSGLELTVGQEVVVNLTLQIGSAAQTVSVTGEAPLINTTSGSLGGLVDEQKISDLPLNGRNYVDLMMLQPGISQETNKSLTGGQVGTWFSSNGAPIRSNNYLLDGAILTNIYGAGTSSASGYTLGLDGIQEWRTITNSFSAEYGMTMGSQMVMASKAGTNVFHGSAFEYMRNDVLDAANLFYVPSAADNYARIPPYKRNNFGAAFGGPIKKDKTFFYAAYEGLRERLGVPEPDVTLPTACFIPASGSFSNGTGVGFANPSGCSTAKDVFGNVLSATTVVPAFIQAWLTNLYPQPNISLPGSPTNVVFAFTQPTNDDWGQIRVDQNISAVFARFTIDNSSETAPTAYPQFTTLVQSRNQFLTLSENHIFSPTLLSTARFSFSRTDIPQIDPTSHLNGPLYSFEPGIDIGNVTVNGTTAIGPVATAPMLGKQNIFTLSDDVFKTLGKNALKFGVLFNHYQDEVLRETGGFGSVTFTSIPNFMDGVPQSWTTGLNPPPLSVLGRVYHFDTIGIYAQDDLRLRPTFTLNLGLRYEFSTSYNEENGHGASFRNPYTDITGTVGPPFQNPSLHNFSPRLGFAWDVFGDGKTSVKAGFGVLYDIATFGFSLFQTNLTPPWGSASSHTNSSDAMLTLPFTFGPADLGKTLNGMQWYLKQPQILQYNLAIERQLPGNMALTLAYGGSRGTHIMSTVEGNPVIPSQFVNGQPQWDPYVCGGVLSAVNTGTTCVNNTFFERVNGLVPGTPGNPNLGWSSYQMTGSLGDSWFNSLQVNLTRRLSKGLEVQAAYTYSKSLDDGEGQAGGETTAANIYPAYSQNLRQNKGPSVFDNTNNFRLNAIYQFPDYHSKQGILGTTLSGWGLRTILTDQSPYPFTPAVGTDRALNGASVGIGAASTIDNPDLVPGRSIYSVTHGVSTANGINPCPTAGKPLGTPTLFYDPCAFTLQPIGTLGNVRRDMFRMAAFNDLDFSITKDTPLKFREGAALQFRVETFNIVNHPNLGVPNRTVYTGSSTPGTDAVRYEDPALGIYKKLTLRDGKLVGVILVGDTSDSHRYMDWLRSGTDLTKMRRHLFFPVPVEDKGLDTAQMPDHETVCGCLGVTKGSIIQAIHEKGVNTLAQLKECTRASTGCGSCTELCQQLLKAVAPEFQEEIKTILCKCVPFAEDNLREILRSQKLRSVQEVLDIYGNGQGCEVCKPALSYMMDMIWCGDHDEDRSARFINDRVHANIQKDGTFSVVPRIRGGVTSAAELRRIADVADKYNVPMVKITGSQRIDLLGVKKSDLPKIWADLGMPSGQAYTKGVRMVKTCVGTDFCRYGVQDSTSAGIELERRLENLYTPHKVKMGAVGCPRNCAEATVKDIGIIGQEGSWQVVVGGAAGKSVRKADLLITVVSTEEALNAAEVFFQYYRENANYLERTYGFVERLGIEKVRKDTVYAPDAVRHGLLERLHKSKALAPDPWLERDTPRHPTQFVQIQPIERIFL